MIDNKLVLIDGLLRIEANTYGDDNIVYPFKGRTIDISKPILVYRNLNKKGKWYSVKQNGLVVAHTTAICVRNVKFIVNNCGKNKAIKEQQRNVHAYIKGEYDTSGMGTTAKRNNLAAIIEYSPFNELKFHCKNLISKIFEVKGARFCIINEDGVKASYIERY